MKLKMPISKIVIARHALRLDTVDKQWLFTSPTPYDSPLVNPRGFSEARNCGEKIKEILLEKNGLKGPIVVHSSPFLRCVQTSAEICESLKTPQRPSESCSESYSERKISCQPSVTIRIDSVFGEWLTEDYYQHIPPPPSDGNVSLQQASLQWLKLHLKSDAKNGLKDYRKDAEYLADQHPIFVDDQWDLHKFGFGGEYGESWNAMHERVGEGLRALIGYYNGPSSREQTPKEANKEANTEPENITIVIVTHGALCNSLLAHLSNQPLLQKIALASFAIAEPYEQDFRAAEKDQLQSQALTQWAIVYNSSSKQYGSSEMLQHLSASVSGSGSGSGSTPTSLQPMFSPSSLTVSPVTHSTTNTNTNYGLLGPISSSSSLSSNSSSFNNLNAFFGSNNDNTISQNINKLELDKRTKFEVSDGRENRENENRSRENRENENRGIEARHDTKGSISRSTDGEGAKGPSDSTGGSSGGASGTPGETSHTFVYGAPFSTEVIGRDIRGGDIHAASDIGTASDITLPQDPEEPKGEVFLLNFGR